MELRAVVFYKGALAYYGVEGNRNDGEFNAALARYDGKQANHPPQSFLLKKEGRHWHSGSCSEQDLLDDIGNAIESGQET